MMCTGIRTMLLLALSSVKAKTEPVLRHPEGPAQHCRDDAGPPWDDDEDNFPKGKAYFDKTPAEPRGECPGPLEAACAKKGKKAAFLDGPIDCGKKGWFCRIMPQAGWRNPEYDDKNFAHCNGKDADERDNDGHCHGSDSDNTYGWWVRDHWFRGYAGTLTCSCGFDKLEDLVNRCDYREHVDAEGILGNGDFFSKTPPFPNIPPHSFRLRLQLVRCFFRIQADSLIYEVYSLKSLRWGFF